MHEHTLTKETTCGFQARVWRNLLSIIFSRAVSNFSKDYALQKQDRDIYSHNQDIIIQS